jgi:hypothetical protein
LIARTSRGRAGAAVALVRLLQFVNASTMRGRDIAILSAS